MNWMHPLPPCGMGAPCWLTTSKKTAAVVLGPIKIICNNLIFQIGFQLIKNTHRAELPRRRPPDPDLHVGDARRVLLVGAVARADGPGDLERRLSLVMNHDGL